MRRVRHLRAARSAFAATVVVAAVPLAAAADPLEVLPGDTLSEIAAARGLDPAALAARNGIDDPDRLLAGSVLRLDGAAAPEGADQPVTVTIRPGDTLSALAEEVGSTVDELVTLNGIADPDRIRVGQRLVAPRAPEPSPAPVPEAVDPRTVERVLDDTARRYGWDPAYVRAIAWQESGWQMDVVSSAGAVGVMQVLPSTAVEMSRAHGLGRTLDPTVLEDNVLAGVLLLETLDDLTDGDRRLIAAGYFQGLGNIRRDGMLDRTVRYVDNVLALQRRFAD